MNQIIVAFITGLTTGGLSCLAVQGGLLASSLAHQLEVDVLAHPTTRKKRFGPIKNQSHSKTAWTIAFFLCAKLAAYTVLGFLLGLLGSVLTLNSTMRSILFIAIGIFMVGNALRIMNVHPLFRYFVIEPPKFINRYIRRTAKNGTEVVTPLFLGALTVLIPCGVTQAMMAVALATGNPFQGAILMFAFILGTSPVFFIVAYLTTQIGTRLEKWFMRFVAVVLLGFGLVSINNGLVLIGSPIAITNPEIALSSSKQVSSQQAAPSVPNTLLTLSAVNSGYLPRTLYAKADAEILMNVVTQGTYSCARALVIPYLRYETVLPETGTISIHIPPQPVGTVIRFSCSMGMYTGKIVFSQ